MPHYKHKMSKTRLFTIWMSMRNRCNNRNHMGYARYGGRGITICSEWLEEEYGFINFYQWAIENNYKDNLSIDRIDGNGNYEPSNCRWATHKEQQSHTSKTIFITYKEKTKTLIEWCEILKMNYNTIKWRYDNKWPIEKLFQNSRHLIANKQSGIKGIIWAEKSQTWHVKGIKNNKPDKYLKSFKTLEEAIQFKNNYENKT